METIRRCQYEMSRNPMFPYLIEVVTDSGVFEAPFEPDILQLKVPATYETRNKTKFKARALHYACEYSAVPPTTWVVHLDEETQPSSSGVKGIAAFVAECERTNDLTRIGQGCITYHRAFEKYPFLTLADMRRTGDDLSHFYLQHRLGFTLFGLHGAFIVCRQDKEAAIGFDLGPAGSITEDSWWVLLALQEGYRTGWVDGFLEEQSTQSVMDFLKQRRRWYHGLAKVVTRCPVDLKYRFPLGFNVILWWVGPILIPAQLAHIAAMWMFSVPLPMVIRIWMTFSASLSSLMYVSGLTCNMMEHRTKWWKVPMLLFAMVMLQPFCQLLEIISVLMAFFSGWTKEANGFHVVQKSAHSADRGQWSGMKAGLERGWLKRWRVWMEAKVPFGVLNACKVLFN
ncbi:Glycosyltransferase 2 [Gracilaria domingensis]|nr:Glycosyltransferase 2 [Gracilaria domingensis]